MSALPTQKTRLAALPALMFAGGLGMVMYYGHAWWRLPEYSAAEIEQSVELNLALDLQRHPTPPAEAELATLRQQVHADVVAAIASDKQELQGYTGTGLILMAMGLAQMVVMRRMAAR